MRLDVRRMRAIIRKHLWDWDPYGVNQDREIIPDEYDDWVDMVVRVLLKEATTEAIERAFRARMVEEGLNLPFIEGFDVEQLLADIPRGAM